MISLTKPDIVTMAKGIGNGFPMAAVVTTKGQVNVICVSSLVRIIMRYANTSFIDDISVYRTNSHGKCRAESKLRVLAFFRLFVFH